MDFILTSNYVLTILWKIENIELTFDLFFKRYNQFTLIKSSIKDTRRGRLILYYLKEMEHDDA